MIDSEYVYIKLTNGDDLISYKVSETETSIKLLRPIVIRQSFVGGEFKPTASAYCGLAKGNIVDVLKTSCIFLSEMRDEAKLYYSSLSQQHYTALDQLNKDAEAAASAKASNIELDLEDNVVSIDDKKVKASTPKDTGEEPTEPVKTKLH